MKSQDIVVLFKIESLHQRWKDKLPFYNDIFAFPPNGENWIGESNHSPSSPSEEYIERLFSVRALESETGISKTQVNLSLKRMYKVGLVKDSRRNGLPTINSKSLLEFIAYGIRYVFPAELGRPARGVPTSIAAPVLKNQLMAPTDLIPVWPHHLGTEKGLSVKPLHDNIVEAIKSDSLCYALLALTDAVRLGQPRERNLAINFLEKLLGVK